MSPRASIRKNGAAAEAAPTPSAAIVQAATKTKTVVDSLGRSITVRKFSALTRMKFAELVGAAAASNAQYLGVAALAAAVIEIDGDRVAFPTSKRELEALVQRLDDEGIEAIGPALAELAGIKIGEDGEIINDETNPVTDAKN